MASKKSSTNKAASSSPRKTAYEQGADPLRTPVQFLKGVGEKFSKVLNARGIRTVEDVLFFFPRIYEDRRKVTKIRDLKVGEKSVVRGQILRAHPVFFSRSRRRCFEVLLTDESSGILSLLWFRPPFFQRRLEPGRQVTVYGPLTEYRMQLQMVHPQIEIHKEDENEEAFEAAIVPIYTEFEGLYQATIRKLVHGAVASHSAYLTDRIPKEFLQARNLPKLFEAVRALHAPEPGVDFESLLQQKTRWHERIIYEDFFYLSLGLAQKKVLAQATEKTFVFSKPEKSWETLKDNLGFSMTTAQKRVLKEILSDQTSPKVMQRLVQGDVGSGKTAVAAATALVALEAQAQVALMAPTEVLVDQHARNFERWFRGLSVKMAKLTGSTPKAERTEILKALQSGEIQMIFGTHALFEDEVEFQKLGLVIVDEQHRFGVRQRTRLLEKGRQPDLLVMTATPIPRTLALVLYGDLDVSVIDELPPGRTRIVTKVSGESERAKVFQFLKDQVKAQKQAYLIFPLIEDSEHLKAKSLETYRSELEAEFSNYRLGFLHGRLKSDEKKDILEKFRQNAIQILVSTTVVEVGVDVPNATVMVIENADRFGLSQLHQLRGRVGRGAEKSYCFLMVETGNPEVLERLKHMEKVSDGFRLSEIDLELRGPGELLGLRQSGAMSFALARLPRDLNLLEAARRDAFQLLEKDPSLSSLPELKRELDLRLRDVSMS